MRHVPYIRDVIMFLRYQNLAPQFPEKTYMKLKDIAKHVSRSITYV